MLHNIDPLRLAPPKGTAKRGVDADVDADSPYDLRFRALLGAEEWAALPEAVQARFSKRLALGSSANYCGHVIHCRMNIWGRIFSQACRLIGAPLPLDTGGGTAANVSVTEDGESGGQNWSRIYARRNGFPQTIHSAKRFAGPSGLEEFVGRRLGVTLGIERIEHGIRFVGACYFVMMMGRRWVIPALLSPGELIVDHRDLGDGSFTFRLKLDHRVFGEMIHQHCQFRDMPEVSDKRAPPVVT